MKLAALGATVLALFAYPAFAQIQQQYFYDAQGRLVATTSAPANAGNLSRYDLDNADNRTNLTRTATPTRAAQDELRGGESLLPSQFIKSLDNRFTFTLRTDGNLEIVGPTGSLWSSNTDTGQSMVLNMQTDGNAGIRNPAFVVIWQTSTGGHSGAFFKMKNDGNLVILDGSTQIWQSNTCCH